MGQSSRGGKGVTSEILAGESIGREADVDGRGEDRQRQDEQRRAHRRVRKNAERKGRADDEVRRESVSVTERIECTSYDSILLIGSEDVVR